MRKINEECGVFGAYRVPQAASHVYYGLHALQHRGQEGAGIAVLDESGVPASKAGGTKAPARVIVRKGHGLVTDVFPDLSRLKPLEGASAAIGHVRYSTQGGEELENVQPLIARSHFGDIAVVHNGQIVNAAEIKAQQEDDGHIFQGTSDSEIVLHLIRESKASTMMDKVKEACRQLEGAFAFLILTGEGLFAVRDKNGLRPLSIASFKDGFLIGSETCSFETVGANFWRDVLPGEVIHFSEKGPKVSYYTEERQHKLCSMEYIYFARQDSDLDGLNVHRARKTTGQIMAGKDIEEGLKADIVVGVPDSALSAAIGYSEAAHLPYEMGLTKNRYIGRTFIEPTQDLREIKVRMKLSVNRQVIEGKKIVLIDDSIVRSTTMKQIIKLLKGAGAREIHVRIMSPEYKYPCFYGIDTATQKELISAQLTPRVLCSYLGADSLKFLSIDDLKEAYGTENICVSCFSGEYVTDLYSHGK